MERPRVLPRHRLQAWTATAVLVAVSVLHLAAAAGGRADRDPVALVSVLLGVAGVLTAIRFVTARCFESRVAMVLLSAATVLAALLTHTVGAPGAHALPWTPRDVVLTVLAAALAAVAWRATAVAPAEASCPR